MCAGVLAHEFQRLVLALGQRRGHEGRALRAGDAGRPESRFAPRRRGRSGRSEDSADGYVRGPPGRTDEQGEQIFRGRFGWGMNVHLRA